MYNSDMFAGGHRPDLAKIIQGKKDGNAQPTQGEVKPNTNISSNEDPVPYREEFDLSKVSKREEEAKTKHQEKKIERPRSRSRSKSPQVSKETKSAKPVPEIKKDEPKDKEPVEESKVDKPLSKEEKLRLAKEKLLKRKTEQPI